MAAIHADNIKAANVLRVASVHREKHRRGTRQLALLACIDGQHRLDETRLAAISNFNEHEAAVVEHDEVDLAMAAAKIVANWPQAFVSQETKRHMFGVFAQPFI